MRFIYFERSLCVRASNPNYLHGGGRLESHRVMSHKQWTRTVSTETERDINILDFSMFVSCAQLQTTLQFIPNQLILFYFILLAIYWLFRKNGLKLSRHIVYKNKWQP